MAKNSSLEELYITLGLDVSELTSDFIEVDKTISQNLAKINREKNFIKLNAQIDINNLDPVKDAQEILKIKSNELTDIIEGQRQKVKLLETAWLDLANSHGYNSDVTRKAEERHLKETVALQNLERELKNLTNAKDNASGEDLSKLASGIQIGNIDFSSLQGSISEVKSTFGTLKEAASGSISSALELAGKLKVPWLAAGAAILALPPAALKVEESLINLAKPAINAGNAIKDLADNMGVSTKEAGAFNTACRLMGADANGLVSSLQKIGTAWTSAGANSNAVVAGLKQFGVALTNSDGTLKSKTEQMQEIAQGFERAKASGQGLQLQQVLIAAGYGDLAKAANDYKEAVENSGNLVKADIDVSQAEDLQKQFDLLEAQQAQIGNAFSAALMPVAETLLPDLIKTFGELTAIIKQSSEDITYFGEVAGSVLKGVASFATTLAGAIASVGKGLREVIENEQSASVDIAVKNKDSEGKDLGIDSYEDFKEHLLRTNADPSQLIPQDTIVTEALEKAFEAQRRKMWEKILAERQKIDAEAQAKLAEQNQNVEQSNASGNSSEILTQEEMDAQKRIAEYQQEIDNLRITSTNKTYENQIRQIENWKQTTLNNIAETKYAEEERANVIALAEAKIQDAKRKTTEESQQRTQDYLSEAQSISSERTLSAYEKEIAQIEKWKQKAMEKAETVQDLGQKAQEVAAIEADAAAKAADAYEKEVERIKNATKSFQDEIYELTHSKYENDMKKLWEKYQKGLSEGVDKDTMDAWFRLKQAEVDEKARHDVKGEYTRPGQFQYTPNYDVPNYVAQAREAIGVIGDFNEALQTSSQQLENYNDQLNQMSDPAQVTDVFGNVKEGWTQVTGEMSNTAKRYQQATQQFSNSTQQFQSASAGLSSLPNTSQQKIQNLQRIDPLVNAPYSSPDRKAEYTAEGTLAYGWTRSFSGRVLSFSEELAQAQKQMLGIPNLTQNQFQNPYQNDTVNANLTNASMQLSEAANNLSQASAYQEQNDQFSQITDAINNMQGNKNPIEINVNIGNAVTTDSEGMTQLADMVADKIAPVVENAIGNSENSY